MTPTEYTKLALVTESKFERLNFSRGGLINLLTLLALSADIADQAKKTMAYGKPFDDVTFAAKLRKLATLATDMNGRAERIARVEDQASDLHEPNMRILHAGIGIFGEAGEILEAIIKQVQTGELDLINVGEEGGDVDWYRAILADESGLSIEKAWEQNIAKLKVRYGDKFDAKKAENRDLAAERAVLESTGAAANDASAQQAA
ncbi:hypothetical protein D9M72_137350 [compost metagenome]